MTNILYRVLLFFLIALPTAAIAQEKKTITVLNSKFEIITVIVSPELVAHFESIWNTRAEVSAKVKPSWKYKIDLIGIKPSGRWLYDPAGYVTKLSHKQRHLYLIASNDQFNRLLGIRE